MSAPDPNIRATAERLLAEMGRKPAPRPDPKELARLVGMPLDMFVREGQPLEVRVPWWPETLFFVPDERHAEALRREGIARHRIWTAAELLLLPWEPPIRPDALHLLTVVRREFGGEVIAVRATAEARPPGAGAGSPE
jgi:hypothetical protein